MFSVVIATRNRPREFHSALSSVLAQKQQPQEIIVIDDGSVVENVQKYKNILSRCASNARYFSLIQRRRGHGSAYAHNFGVSLASTDYVCFLDDDDWWTDNEHLARAKRIITGQSPSTDIYLSNQKAYSGKELRTPVWLENLEQILHNEGQSRKDDGSYSVTVQQLLKAKSHAHTNTLIVRRTLYEDVGGQDEGLRWECDRDIYLRLIDAASSIVFCPEFVSHHNIPDPNHFGNMTTSISEIEKRLYQLRVFDKAALFSKHKILRDYGRRQKGFTLKRITAALSEDERYSDAFAFALEALAIYPTFKWTAYCTYLKFRAISRD